MLDGSLRTVRKKIVQLVRTLATSLMFGIAAAATAQDSPSQKMAATVIQQWPAGVVSTVNNKGQWAYEEGVLLDGMAAEWHTTANGADFAYIKAAVDKYVTADGTITGYKADGHTLDDIEMGRATLLVYRVTQQEKYAKAAKFLEDQLAVQPRTASGGLLAQADLSEPDVARRRLHGRTLPRSLRSHVPEARKTSTTSPSSSS